MSFSPEENIEGFKESCRAIGGELKSNVLETEFSCEVITPQVDTKIVFLKEHRLDVVPSIKIFTKVALPKESSHGIPAPYDIVGNLYEVEEISVEEEPADMGVAFPPEMEIIAKSGSATISAQGLKEFRIGEK